MMGNYGTAVKKLGKKYGAIVVDVQAAFDRYLEGQPTHTLCSDRVHPNLTGHMIIAKAFVDAVGFNWS